MSGQTFRSQWEDAIRSARIGRGTTLAVAFIMATYCTYADGTNIRPSVKTVADGMGMSERAVKDGLANLRKLGWLAVVARGNSFAGKATEYRLAIPGHYGQPAAPGDTYGQSTEPTRGSGLHSIEAAGFHAGGSGLHSLGEAGCPPPVQGSIQGSIQDYQYNEDRSVQVSVDVVPNDPWAGLGNDRVPPPAASGSGEEETPSPELPPSVSHDDEVEPPLAALRDDYEDQTEPFAAASSPAPLGHWAEKEQRRQKRRSDREAGEMKDVYVPFWSGR